MTDEEKRALEKKNSGELEKALKDIKAELDGLKGEKAKLKSVNALGELTKIHSPTTGETPTVEVIASTKTKLSTRRELFFNSETILA